jgi:hypothetical protein
LTYAGFCGVGTALDVEHDCFTFRDWLVSDADIAQAASVEGVTNRNK